MTPEEIRTAADRYANGETQAALAAEYGVSEATMFRRLAAVWRCRRWRARPSARRPAGLSRPTGSGRPIGQGSDSEGQIIIVIGGPSNAHPPPAEGPAQIRYTCCTSISRWVVAILGGGPLFGTDHARCCSSALDAAADTPRYADPLWSGLKTDSLRHFTGKEVSPMGREGPERRLVAPLNACPLPPWMQERSSLSVYLSFMGASLRNRGQSSARHGITSPQPTRRYTRAPRFGTGR